MYLPTGADITEQGLNYLGVVGTTASYTMVFTDDIVMAYGFTGGLTITLPTSVGINGRVLRVKNLAPAGVITMAAFGSELIDGVAPSTVKVLFNDCLWFVAVSGGWWII